MLWGTPRSPFSKLIVIGLFAGASRIVGWKERSLAWTDKMSDGLDPPPTPVDIDGLGLDPPPTPVDLEGLGHGDAGDWNQASGLPHEMVDGAGAPPPEAIRIAARTTTNAATIGSIRNATARVGRRRADRSDAAGLESCTHGVGATWMGRGSCRILARTSTVTTPPLLSMVIEPCRSPGEPESRRARPFGTRSTT